MFYIFIFYRSLQDDIVLLMYNIESNNTIVIENQLKNATEADIYDAVLPNWIIYFDTTITKNGKRVTSFSEFASFCIFNNTFHDKEPNNELSTLASAFLAILLHLLAGQTLKLDVIVRLFVDYITSHFGTKKCYNGQQMLKLLLEKFYVEFFHVSQLPEVNDDKFNETSLLSNSSDSSDSSLLSNSLGKDQSNIYRKKTYIDSLLILLRIYLDEWRKISDEIGIFQKINKSTDSDNCKYALPNSCNVNNNNHVVCNSEGQVLFGRRYSYLDLICPFYGVNDEIPLNILKSLQKLLAKIQSILCLNIVNSKIQDEVHRFLNSNEQLYGTLSILSCIIEPSEACLALIDTEPHCLHIIGRERFKLNSEWKYLLNMFIKKIIIDVDKRDVYSHLFKG